jgi:glucuronate isomerase
MVAARLTMAPPQGIIAALYKQTGEVPDLKQYMDHDFLLTTDTAKMLFHEAAENMPIYDYHCHLNPKDIAENIRFRNITHLMLSGDHYKWRAMLAYGIDEKLIRGDGDEKEKFFAFARMLPHAIGNPLYHWTHLELRRVFGIDIPLNENSAEDIWNYTNELLTSDEYRAQGLIDSFNVDTLCTTDDPRDDLAWHKAIAGSGTLKAHVLPAFRPDKAINVMNTGFSDYITELSAAAGMPIRCTDDVLAALENRIDYFHSFGTRLSDHALDTVPAGDLSRGKADKAFFAAMAGETVKAKHAGCYRATLLTALGGMYAKRGWVQQYHIGAMRNNNNRMFRMFGPDTGFDCVTDAPIARNLSSLMDSQEKHSLLPKTILYSLNPAAQTVIGSMIGSFQQSGVQGKVQMGSAWWFLDQKDGMTEQMKTLGNMGLLSGFVGMLTDSRSFISYPRHEYFRRIFCGLIGDWVENGEYPNDPEFLKTLVRNISYNNAKTYFGT